MTDILERLRLSVTKGHEPTDEDAIEAADEIARLTAERETVHAMADENERLRAAVHEASHASVETQDLMQVEIERLRADNARLRAAICDALDDEVSRRFMSHWCAKAITAIGYDPALKDTTP